MDRFSEIKEKILEYAVKDEDIKAIIAIGSSTRRETPADEYSDLDLIIATEKVDTWFSGEYPKKLGNVNISFLEPTLGGGKERRSIYEDDLDVDMIIFTPEQLTNAIKEGVAGWVMNRGYQILYDANDYESMIKQHVVLGHSKPEMNEEEFNNIVNDFYFHNIWAAKKLKRGEIWSAKMCVDAYLKGYLLRMIEYYRFKVDGMDVWHDGRFIDRWAGEEIRNKLTLCFAHYNDEDIARALIETHDLFETVTRRIAEKEGYAYPERAILTAKTYLEIVS